MLPSSTSVALVVYSSTSDNCGYIQDRGTWKRGLGFDVRYKSSGGVGFGPVVAALWSR